jgi:large subunit ribosomal protein L19
MSIIDDITRDSLSKKIPRFKAGDTVRVYLKIKEGEKERVQFYEGVVIAIHRNGISTTFKVRKESYGVGVERTFPLFSPLIQKIEVKRRGDVRRAKLYYLRKLSGKKAKVKERKDWMLKKSEVELQEADREMEQELPPEEEVAVGAAAEVADAAPVEGEADAEILEEAVEVDAAEDAPAGDPVVGEDADLEAEAQPEEPEPLDDSVAREEGEPAAEAAEEKGVEDSPPKAPAKKEKAPRKPRKKKSEQNG